MKFEKLFFKFFGKNCFTNKLGNFGQSDEAIGAGQRDTARCETVQLLFRHLEHSIVNFCSP